MKTKQIIKDFIKWLNEEDRQNWEIERYFEAVIMELRKETKK